MIDCYCDYDPPSVYSSKLVHARKPYKCYECGRAIQIGERHEYAFGVCDGFSYQPRTCASCLDLRQFVKNNIPCFCWGHGSLHEDVENVLDQAYYQAPEEVRGLRFGVGRLLVKARQLRRAA